MNPDSKAVSEAVNELTTENATRAQPFLNAMTMLHVKLPRALVNRAHCIGVGPLSMGHRHSEVADVAVTEAVRKYALATGVAELPCALISCRISPLHTTLSVPEISTPLPLVYSAILVPIFLVVNGAVLSNRLRLERFEYLLSGEVPSMHPIHVPHFNAVSNSLLGQHAPEEGLNFDYHLDVRLH